MKDFVRVTIQCVSSGTVAKETSCVEEDRVDCAYPDQVAKCVALAVVHYVDFRGWIESFLDTFILELREFADCDGFSLGEKWDKVGDEIFGRMPSIKEDEDAD